MKLDRLHTEHPLERTLRQLCAPVDEPKSASRATALVERQRRGQLPELLSFLRANEVARSGEPSDRDDLSPRPKADESMYRLSQPRATARLVLDSAESVGKDLRLLDERTFSEMPNQVSTLARLLRVLATAVAAPLSERAGLRREWELVGEQPEQLGLVLAPMVARSHKRNSGHEPFTETLSDAVISDLDLAGATDGAELEAVQHWVELVCRDGARRIRALRFPRSA